MRDARNFRPLQILRFGDFEVDLRAGQLRRNGARVRLQDQPFQVLAVLLEHAGEVVSREELRQRLWPSDTFVDFDNNLNTAINKIREAFGDSAEKPHFVETLLRRGYRFIASAEDSRCNSPRIMLAVLPFQNLSGDPQQEYFSDGMTEEMIAQLGRLHPNQLAVIARPTAMQYKDTTKRIDEIGRELGVEYILAGSVRRGGDRVRITAELAQVRNQTQLWADSYDRDFSDILAVQKDVAQSFAREIRLTLTPWEQARLTSPEQVDPESYEDYLKGRYYWNKRTEVALQKAAGYFRQSIEKSPGYAPAYAGLADSLIMLGEDGYGILPPHEVKAEAKGAALKALEIDGTLAEGHTSLGSVKEQFDWDWVGSEIEFKRAIELQPGYALAHHWYAYILAQLNRLEEARGEITRARELDPLSLIINADFGWVLYLARRYDQAVKQLWRTLELDPGFARANYLLGQCYLEQASYDKAVVQLRKAAELSQYSPVYFAGLGCAYAKSGKRSKATQVLRELKETSKRRYVPAYDIALMYIALGNKDDALAWLEKAFEEGSDFRCELSAGPMLDPMRSDPHFQHLLRRMNLPE